MVDLPPQPAVAAETIFVTGQAITPAAGSEAFGAVRLDADALRPASGRVEDGLRNLGGVQLFRASSTRTANPTAEGITARGLAGNAASRVLVTLDGVPIVDPFFGFVAWGNLIGRPIGGAELVRGGGAGGPGALAGTLALETGPAVTRVELRAGERGSANGSGALALPVGSGSLLLFGGLSRGDGHLLVDAPGPADVPARYRQWAAGGRAVAARGNLRLAATLSAFDDRRLRGVVGADIRSNGGDASLRLTRDGGWRVDALVHAQLRDFSTVTRTLDPARSVATTALDQLKTPATGWGARFALEPPLGNDAALSVGGEWRAADGFTTERFRYVAGLPTRQRRAGGSQQTASLFADGSARVTPELLLTAAGRIDRWRLGVGTLREIDLTTGGATLEAPSAARAGTEASGRVGALWRPLPAIRLRAAGYRGWRLPTLNELHRPFRAGQDATAANPALAPERLWGAEASIAWQPLAAIDLSATVFTNRLDNAIANVTIGAGPGVFPGVGFVPAGGRYRQRQNLGSIRSHGVEADAKLTLGATRVGGSIAWVDAVVRETAGTGAGLNGLRPAQAPELSGSLTLGHDARAFDVSATMRHLGARYEDDLNSRRLAPATTVDAELSVPLGGAITLLLAAENLLDADIETGLSGSQVERGQPRTLWLGLRWGGS
jgi:outer membrane receptor protein involved in Fe transport